MSLFEQITIYKLNGESDHKQFSALLRRGAIERFFLLGVCKARQRKCISLVKVVSSLLEVSYYQQRWIHFSLHADGSLRYWSYLSLWFPMNSFVSFSLQQGLSMGLRLTSNLYFLSQPPK